MLGRSNVIRRLFVVTKPGYCRPPSHSLAGTPSLSLHVRMAGTLVCLSGLAGMDCYELMYLVRNAVVPVASELTDSRKLKFS